jgi:hypothetical protein
MYGVSKETAVLLNLQFEIDRTNQTVTFLIYWSEVLRQKVTGDY